MSRFVIDFHPVNPQYMENLVAHEEELDPIDIERNKDKLNLKPSIDFVSNNIGKFEDGLQALLSRNPSAEAQKWADGIEFVGAESIVEPQVSPEEARKILARMPEVLIKLSHLKDISYITFGHSRVIPVPGYDDKGNFDSKKVELVSIDDFPRPQDHPSRILVGVSNGKTIYPTPIPKTVSEDKRAVLLYQIHVMIHEFFHTIDYTRRDPALRSAVLLETDGEKFTLQDWWNDFEKVMLSSKESDGVSTYADIYKNDLNQTVKEEDNGRFTRAIAEQICETFVAYQLGIISNNQGLTEINKESFGEKWALIDKLCRAKIVE